MNKLHILYTTTLAAIFFITSCSNDKNTDTEKPVIILNNPKEGEIITPGTVIHFDADFSDNEALGSYKIDIHNASDGHTHRDLTTDTNAPWIFNESYTIEGDLKNTHIHKHIAVPTEITAGLPIKEGAYHLGVYLTDKAGNQQQVFIKIVIGPGGEDHTHH